MKFPTLLNSLLTISLLSITAQAYYEYDPLKAREWADNVFVREGGSGHHVHELKARDDMLASLTTRELVEELETRLYRRDKLTLVKVPGATPPPANRDTPLEPGALPLESKPMDDRVPNLPKVHDSKKQPNFPKKSAMKKSNAGHSDKAPKKVAFDI